MLCQTPTYGSTGLLWYTTTIPGPTITIPDPPRLSQPHHDYPRPSITTIPDPPPPTIADPPRLSPPHHDYPGPTQAAPGLDSPGPRQTVALLSSSFFATRAAKSLQWQSRENITNPSNNLWALRLTDTHEFVLNTWVPNLSHTHLTHLYSPIHSSLSSACNVCLRPVAW